MRTKHSVLFVLVVIILTLVLIGPGNAMSETLKVPRVSKVEIDFFGKGKASYDINPTTGCIQNFYYGEVTERERIPIDEKKPPFPGLVENKKTVDFGSFTDAQCRQGVISITGSPTEYWGYANGRYYCIGAWDPECPNGGHWFQPCKPDHDYKCP